MTTLRWKINASKELPMMLTEATVENSAAIGTSTLYHLQHEGKEKLAVAIPGGQTLIIEMAHKNKRTKKSRKIDLKS